MAGARAATIQLPLTGGTRLAAELLLPERPLALVLILHGSGSNRFSPRNRQLAEVLQQAGLASLRLDLLSAAEQADPELAAATGGDLPRLAGRVIQVIDALGGSGAANAAEYLNANGSLNVNNSLAALPLGLCGASSGAAVALLAAAARPDPVRAVVCRGGRPDLAAAALTAVRCPVLLIVGSLDRQVLELNHRAAALLPQHSRLAVVAGAGHLFEQSGTLAEAAALARDWFLQTPPGGPTQFRMAEPQERAGP